MIKFSKDKVLLLHQYIAAETGGAVGVRDEALLESALEAAFATFDGRELYPSKEEKAARLGASLVANHAFLDGNKRIGMYVVLTFLETNGVRLDCSDDDIVRAGLALADGSMGYEGLLGWIRERCARGAPRSEK
ncbi:MAG: type II toxin-antitoxin system death-on-curing family toxin [Kiritimatiellae bacterium]|nr:type II toxin-antitoxin system death-on-curing family toxin [Kiritimatiellia bacterium]